ncbi:Replication initiator protein A [Rubripirellula reticaptiva]|uniref:Replication initiator protein A n=2 Tax=Rubripirellula reticaptiva TaxID=2528013 RepID=A0A5C6EMQ6_9BACT|nr:Replication initiator protein A [Rubripirellula reticaptiva]
MNLVEIPFGPISKTQVKTLEVEHETYDKQLKRYVTRKLLMTGTDAFGLPQPIDDQVIVGLKALTCKAKFESRRVEFSRYQLCKEIGWPTDGRSYRRLEDSLDRIASTTLKFKDYWWDKGDQAWKSKTFTLIGSVQICSRDEFDRARKNKTGAGYQLCSFEWSEVVWKSFTDGYVKKVDMEMFRRVSSGRSKEVAVRLYRVLDKRLYKKQTCNFKLERLCKGIIGLSDSYCPSEMKRILERAAKWLVTCGCISGMEIKPDRKTGELMAIFRRVRKLPTFKNLDDPESGKPASRPLLQQFDGMKTAQREKLLKSAIEFSRTHHPEQYEGFQRSEQREGEASRAYLELILRTFLAANKKNAA